MFKIIIADDNPLIRMGLKNMIQWDKFNACLVGEGRSGEEALELIDKEAPDMVITDIRMPGTDGIYLLNKLKEEYPQICTIVVSAYDDFNYAREAIKAGSIDYILKPIHPKELNETIAKGLEVKQRGRNGHENLSLQGREHYFFVLKANKEYSVPELTMILSGIEGLEVYQKQEMFFIITSGKESSSGEVFERIKKQINYPYLLGSRKVLADEPLEAMWEEAVASAGSFIIENGLPKTVKWEKIRRGEDCCKNSNRWEEPIALFCMAGDEEKVMQLFYNLIWDNWKQEGLFDEIYQFLQMLLMLDRELFEKAKIMLDKVKQQNVLLSYITMDEIVQDMKALVESICRESRRVEGGRRELAERVKELIDKSYQNDVSLSRLAQLFYITPSYLSRIFKQEIGCNLNHYITQVRMDQAKRLLEHTEKKVSDVANEVGYTDVVYFTKNYKKMFGHAPNTNRPEKKKIK